MKETNERIVSNIEGTYKKKPLLFLKVYFYNMLGFLVFFSVVSGALNSWLGFERISNFIFIVIGLVMALLIGFVQYRGQPLEIRVIDEGRSIKLLIKSNTNRQEILLDDLSSVDIVRSIVTKQLLSLSLFEDPGKPINFYCLYGVERPLLREILRHDVPIYQTNGSDYKSQIYQI